jgi:hypothetical protein
MKKLFTLLALLTCFIGAKAEWIEDFKVDYSSYQGFPFMVMGYVPEWVDGVMTDLGGNYTYAKKADEDAKEDGQSSDVIVKTSDGTEYYRLASTGTWHQYIIANKVPNELDQTYTIKVVVKASEAVTMNLQFGNWGKLVETQVTIPASDDFQEVEWEVTGCTNSGEGFICAQPNTAATIEWKSLTVSHNQKESRPTVWKEWLTDDGNPIIPGVEHTNVWKGDAEFGAWPDWSLELTDGVNINWRGNRTGEICAWSIVRGKNIDSAQQPDPVNDPDGNPIPEGKPRPFPCDIEEVPAEGIQTGGHAFVVHSTTADNQYTDWQAWDNQFFIMSPKAWKEGDVVKVSFKYKAEKPAGAQTQIHHENPSWYLHYIGIGDVNFTTEWQQYEKELTFDGSQATGWCVAFNLNVDNKEENTFYFDDLKWETMVLDEGFFIAGKGDNVDYDLDNAIQLQQEGEQVYTATIGTAGKKETWVNEVMISTLRGNDASFKGATLKPSGDYIGDSNWGSYTTSSLYKIKLPAAGVWTVTINTEYQMMNFIKVEGEEDKQPEDIVTNPTEIIVKAVERDDLSDVVNGQPQQREEEGGTGETWDNQFFIKANRALETNEVTVLKFKYKSSVADAKTTTQCHGETPGAYMHWAAIGDVVFQNGDWADYEKEFTVPSEANGMWNIAFNLAEIKSACDYCIKDVQWYLKSETEGKTSENLIDATGTKNFFVKIGAGTDPYQYGEDPSGISTLKANAANNAAIYNLAGQKVGKDFKGIVVKSGKKMIQK